MAFFQKMWAAVQRIPGSIPRERLRHFGTGLKKYFSLNSAEARLTSLVSFLFRLGALLLLVMNFIGLGLGPTYVGAASDYFRAAHPHNSLQIALYTLVPFYVVAIVLFLWLARLFRKESRSAEETKL